MNKRRVIIAVAFITVGIMINVCSRGGDEQEEVTVPAVQSLTAAEFMEQRTERPGTVIDVRTQEEYDEGHLAGVDRHHNLLSGEFESALASLDKDGTYYLYCRTGNRSGQAAELMVENGFRNVYNIGGFQDLVDAGVQRSSTP